MGHQEKGKKNPNGSKGIFKTTKGATLSRRKQNTMQTKLLSEEEEQDQTTEQVINACNVMVEICNKIRAGADRKENLMVLACYIGNTYQALENNIIAYQSTNKL